MVGDAAGVAGSGVGAEGFLAGMDGVAREQEGDSEDPHPGTGRWGPNRVLLSTSHSQRRIRGRRGHWRVQKCRGHIDMVDEVPFSVELDGAEAAAEKIHMHRHQRRFQPPEDGIVGGIVEVAPGDDPVEADGGE